MKKTKFESNFQTYNIGKKKCENIHTVVVKDLIFASLKVKSGNAVKSTKSNLKEEELESDVRRCSSKQVF